jgi:hypothetical protein
VEATNGAEEWAEDTRLERIERKKKETIIAEEAECPLADRGKQRTPGSLDERCMLESKKNGK